MKNTVKVFGRILCVLLTLVLILVGLWGLDKFTQRKESYQKNQEFLKDRTDYDVMFFGSSHVLNGIFPMELWKDFGLTSYNFGGHASYIPVSYWTMRNAVRLHKPKVVVLDCFSLDSEAKVADNLNYLHINFDAFPLRGVKIDAIKDLIPQERRMDFYWPFSLYHTRWAGVDTDEIQTGVSVEKGAYLRTSHHSIQADDKSEWLAEADVRINGRVNTTPGYEYLKLFINYCKTEGIEVLLVYLPFDAAAVRYDESAAAGLVAKDQDVNYINFLDNKYFDTVDNHTDFFDDEGHMNASGARKITKFLGNYLTKEYDLKDKREDENYQKLWGEEYAGYKAFKIETLKSTDKIYNYLVQLHDDSYSVFMHFKKGSQLLRKENTQWLTANIPLGGKLDLEKIREAVKAEEDYFLAVDQISQQTMECVGDNGGILEAAFGNVDYRFDDGNTYLYVDGLNGELLELPSDPDKEPEVLILVYDNETGEIIDRRIFEDLE